MLTRLLWIIVLTVCSLPLWSNTVGDPQAYISFSYREASVEEVIEDLEKRHDLEFSYSASSQLMSCRVSSRSGLVKVSEGLKILFTDTPIEHRIIGDQIALRYNRRIAEQLLSQAEPSPPPARKKVKKVKVEEVTVVETPVEPEPEPAPVPTRPTTRTANPIPTETAEEIPWESPPITTNRSAQIVNRQKKRQLGKFSVFPGISNNIGRERDYITTISINAPAGVNGGVVGAEFGLLFNGIDGDLEGLQMGGGFNLVNQQMTGVQLAGLMNVANIGTGVQVAGVANYCRRTLKGVQIAPLLNVALNGANQQYSLGLNVSEGDVRRQIGLVNRAQNVARHQIGLLNISDTISGRPYGLVSFVKKGYTVIEYARTSTVPYAFALRMGAHRFYNLFEFSWGKRKIIDLEDSDGSSLKQRVWSFGYGFGWANRIGNDTNHRVHTDIVGTHINRGSSWMKKLNFNLAFRFTYDFGATGATHFFIGPVMNFHWTQLDDRELDNLYVSGWKIFGQQYDKVLFRGVLGVRFGVRVGQN